MDVKYPDITVKLAGEDGNAFAIMARVRRALANNVSYEAGTEYVNEAVEAESYEAFLVLTARTVNVI